MFKRIIGEGFVWRLLLIMLGVIVIFNSFSSLILYTNVNFSLSPHYGALHGNVTALKESLVRITMKIDLIALIFIAVGVMILGILHSHRVAGPLYRVIQFTGSMGEGDLAGRISFREKDVIHDLATTINKALDGYQNRADQLEHQLMEIEDTLKLLASSSKGSNEEEELMGRLKTLNVRLTEDLEKIKL